MKGKKPLIERNNATKNMTHVGDLDTRKTDDHTDSDLHNEPSNRGYLDLAFSDGIEVINE